MPNRAVWLASGNNVELSDEMTRRIIPIRLDAGVERPEERSGFKHADLPGYVRQHRSELVSACLSLIQAWLEAGQPHGTATLGRFEAWAGVMGGILDVAGVSGFMSGRERLHSEADKETTEWASFCEAWWSTYGERAVTASELFDIVKERKLLLDLWAGRSDLAARQRFGRALTSRRDRVFGGFKLMNAGKDAVTNSNSYRLERIPTPNPGNPAKHLQRNRNRVRDSRQPYRVWGRVLTLNPAKPGKNPVTTRKIETTCRTMFLNQVPIANRVSGVSHRPVAKRNDDLSHLLGTTEGEL